MFLQNVQISQLRNIVSQSLQFFEKFCVFYGQNGSGKSSLLEAIHLLGLGRSFRCRDINKIIQHEQQDFSVYGEAVNPQEMMTPIGIQRNRDGQAKIRIAGESVYSSALLAQTLPLKLINTDSYQLITAGPKIRREFLDWGVFHVEHCYHECWQDYQRIIKQRNALLKMQPKYSELEVWDQKLVLLAGEIDCQRKQYLIDFKAIFPSVLSELLDMEDITLEYEPGWDQAEPYSAVLERNFHRDSYLGYTRHGPHRADLLINKGPFPAADILSRGQQKLLVNAMLLVQGLLLQKTPGKNSIYLIDDLPAELDKRHRMNMVEVLSGMGVQVFVTGVEKTDMLDAFQSHPHQMFHVEHGVVTEV